MTIGAIILPSDSPSLIHAIFNGLSNSGFKNANTRKINDIEIDQNLNVPSPDSRGQTEIKRKTKENKIPKLFSEDFFISYYLKLKILYTSFFKQLLINCVFLLFHLKNSKGT